MDMRGVPVVDKWLFYALKELYSNYRQKLISKAEGERTKKEILRQYEEEKEKATRATKYADKAAKMWREIEAAGSAYRKEPTIEHADAFLEAVYGVGRIGR